MEQVLVTLAAQWLYANSQKTSRGEHSENPNLKAVLDTLDLNIVCLCACTRTCAFIVPQMSRRSALHAPVEGADRSQQQKDYSARSQTVICTKTQSFDTRPLRPPVARETCQVCVCTRLSPRADIACDRQHLCESRSSNGASDGLLRPLHLCTCCPGLLNQRQRRLSSRCGRQKSSLVPCLCKNVSKMQYIGNEY